MEEKLNKLLVEANKILLGKKSELEIALSCIISGGHLLIEDVPGVGKTTLVYLISQLLGLKLSRIQFTNDLLPSDILGTAIYKKDSEDFEFRKGPIFGEMILADELNRATPKTQSALLQAMEEGRVNIEREEFVLDFPFIIVATQNPFYQIGTYQLPESQIDRFHMSLFLNFPERDYEKQILLQKNTMEQISTLESILCKEDLKTIRKEIDEITAKDSLLNFILDLMEKGRSTLEEGVYLSPRAARDLLIAAKAIAYIRGVDFVTPDHVQRVAPYVLGHRLGGMKGIVHGQKLVDSLIKQVPIASA